ncbi:MAG: GTP 3',8-cyclase MoaA [Euryarchaeota archaeon]|nr:GTP 3',8-cyclase MoaA [Euryarchaeota archaeon]MBT5184840.1 GTP 3',8-cyclase MoaA [Euryarchaeota archaeon]
MVRDMRNRPLRDLRISLTDRCNMRCRYCMPREHFDTNHEFLAKKEILSYEELATVVESLIPLGLSKVRLTGGEPLLRKDICKFIKMLPQELDLAMTTNGILLEKFSQDLANSGLDRVTVSLDAIDVETFQAMGDTDEVPETVLRGIEAARKAGLEVKVNTVIRAGYNEHSVKMVADRFIGSDVIVRYIEFMDVGQTNSWNLDEVITGEMMQQMFDELKPLKANHTGEVANRFLRGSQEIGFIESVSKPFCGECNRARISADGALYTCLFASSGSDLKALIRMDATKEQIADAVRSIWTKRDDAYSQNRGSAEHKKVEMSFIGG